MTPIGGEKADSHSKWIVNMAGVLLLSLLAWSMTENYRLVIARQDDQKQALAALMTRAADRDARMDSRVTRLESDSAYFKESQKRIEDKVDLLLKRVR